MPKVEKYGVEWQPVMHGGKIHAPWTEWQIERNMFMWGKEPATAGAKFPKQHLGEAEHFPRLLPDKDAGRKLPRSIASREFIRIRICLNGCAELLGGNKIQICDVVGVNLI